MNDKLDGDFFQSFEQYEDVVYSDIDFVEHAFSNSRNAKALITHNGDRGVTEDLYQKFKHCGKYEVWFAQNIKTKHDDLVCLPIGLERRRNCKFCKEAIIDEVCAEDMQKDKLLYANFSIGTATRHRLNCIKSFESKPYLTNNVQMMTPHNDVLTEHQYREYCRDIRRHKFVLCPEGNGVDTHRLWEALYLGSIPVVLHNYVNDSFEDLPILILDKWEDFEYRCQPFISDTLSTKKNDKLHRKYWKNAIEQALKCP